MHDEPNQKSKTVQEAIARAERVLPGTGENDESRWPAVISVCEHIEANPNEVWEFIALWGAHTNEDLRDAIACCGLEHLLEFHFASYFPRVEKLAKSNPLFADTFGRCWKVGTSKLPANSKRFEQLRNDLGLGPSVA